MTSASCRRRVVACLAAATLAACGAESPRPCVLVVTIDTLRADAVTSLGGEAGLTPHIDALARRGSLFRAATSVTPLTLPTHASLFTGLRPGRHGLAVNGVTAQPFDVPTLAEHLSDAGWTSAAFVSSVILDREYGLGAGFGVYDDELFVPGGAPAPKERRGDHTVDAAVAWLERAAQPWFVWTHLYDPHAPYEAPGHPRGRDRAAYLEEVRFADAQLGRLLAAASRRATRPLLVVLTSDHGESLGEHDEDTHGVLINEGTLHVPLVIAWWDEAPRDAPFATPGAVRDDVVSLLDVTPTILAVLDLPLPDDVDGRSVVAPAPERALPLESAAPWFYYGFSPLTGVRAGPLKLVGAPDADPPDWRLFDLARDPHERAPMDGSSHALRALVPTLRPAEPGPAVHRADDLAALGYMGAQVRPEDGDARIDPRGAMGFVRAVDAANTALVEGDAAAALDVLAPWRAEWSDVPELRLFVGRSLRGLGRTAEAADELAAAHALNPLSADILLEWGKALLQLAAVRPAAVAQAAEVIDRALLLQPDSPEAVALRALHELEFGDPAAAWARIEPVLARRPRSGPLLTVGRRALSALGRDAEASALAARLADLGAHTR